LSLPVRPSSPPLVALTAGDPAGIGPEIVAAVLAEASRGPARIWALGPERCRPSEVPRVGEAGPEPGQAVAWSVTEATDDWTMGSPQASAGRAAIAALRRGHELALAGRVDALVCAPVSKEALHLAGEPVEGQTQLLGRWCGCEDVEMLGVTRALRVLLLTRHEALRAALGRITSSAVLARLKRLRDGLQHLGLTRPRLALAGLNPHAGEHGLYGDEELRELEPAVRAARAEGLDVTGPLSPDTVFLRAAEGEFDGVLALYHDQAFIPLKLHAPGEGVTVLIGLPYLRVSPAHGTAFDLAGQGRADPGNLRIALEAAARWSASWPRRISAPEGRR
jgi:4-hydroxythreonine-4-phosphate dehydrogenase